MVRLVLVTFVVVVEGVSVLCAGRDFRHFRGIRATQPPAFSQHVNAGGGHTATTLTATYRLNEPNVDRISLSELGAY